MTGTTEPMRIVGIAGSLRRSSFNRMLLHAAGETAPNQIELAVWDQLKAIPPFDEDDEQDPGLVVADLRACIAAADGLLVVTPEYNGSLPGQLKNALDWASRPRQHSVLIDKPAAVIGASPSPGGARHAQSDARRVLARAGASVVDIELPVARAYRYFDPEGRLVDEDLRVELGAAMSAFADFARPAVEGTSGDHELAWAS